MKGRSIKNNKIIKNIDEVSDNLTNTSPEEEIIRNEMVALINIHVNNLSDKQKTVFLLRQHGELSFKQISEITKEPINTVLSHMRYAVRKIKKQIENENEQRKFSVI